MRDKLNPGIKETVKWLNSLGYRTCDSGDGETHDYDCDREEPYVVVALDEPKDAVSAARHLKGLLEDKGVEVAPFGHNKVSVEASYDASDDLAFINISGITDRLLFSDNNQRD